MRTPTPPKPRGRPSVPRKQGERSTLSLRVTEDLFKKLSDAATKKGRPLSNEAELRLEQSFNQDDQLPFVLIRIYGRQLAGLLMLLGSVLREAGPSMGFSSTYTLEGADGWLDLPWAFDQAAEAAALIFEAIRPVGSPTPPQHLTRLPFGLGDVTGRTGVGFAAGHLEAVANPANAISANLQKIGAEIRELLGLAAGRIAKNLDRLRKEEPMP